MRFTILAWNAKRVVVATFDGDVNEAHGRLAAIRKALGHRSADARWQIERGVRKVVVGGEVDVLRSEARAADTEGGVE